MEIKKHKKGTFGYVTEQVKKEVAYFKTEKLTEQEESVLTETLSFICLVRYNLNSDRDIKRLKTEIDALKNEQKSRRIKELETELNKLKEN